MSTSTAGASTGQPGTGYARGRERRQAVLRAASELFAAEGFQQATVLDIASACGISRAGLLYHFPDKPTLLAAVLQERDRADQERFSPYVRIPGGVGVLRGMVDLARHNQQVPGLVDLFGRLSTEASNSAHPAHAYFVERYRRIRSGIALSLIRANESGYLQAEVDINDAATRLTALSDGVQIQWLFDPSVDMAGVLEKAIDNILTEKGRLAMSAAAVRR